MNRHDRRAAERAARRTPQETPMSQPGDPLTVLAGGMAQMHEMYQSMIDAGFHRDEAMELLKELMRTGMQQNMVCPHCGKPMSG